MMSAFHLTDHGTFICMQSTRHAEAPADDAVQQAYTWTSWSAETLTADPLQSRRHTTACTTGTMMGINAGCGKLIMGSQSR